MEHLGKSVLHISVFQRSKNKGGETIKKDKTVSLILIVTLIIACTSLGTSAYASLSLSYDTVIEQGSGIETASYVIDKDGSTIYVKDGATGEISYSSSNASDIFTDIIDDASTGDTIYIRGGTYEIDSTITFDKALNLIGESAAGTVFKLTSATTLFVIGDATGSTWEFGNFENFKIDLNGNDETAIQLSGARYVNLRHLRIEDSSSSPWGGLGLDIYATMDYIAWNKFESLSFYHLETCVSIRANLTAASSIRPNFMIFDSCAFINTDTAKAAGYVGVNITAGDSHIFTNCDFENAYYGVYQEDLRAQAGFAITNARFEGLHIGAYILNATESYPVTINILYVYNCDNTTYSYPTTGRGTWVKYWYDTYPRKQNHPLDSDFQGILPAGTLYWCEQCHQFEYWNGTDILEVSNAPA